MAKSTGYVNVPQAEIVRLCGLAKTWVESEYRRRINANERARLEARKKAQASWWGRLWHCEESFDIERHFANVWREARMDSINEVWTAAQNGECFLDMKAFSSLKSWAERAIESSSVT